MVFLFFVTLSLDERMTHIHSGVFFCTLFPYVLAALFGMGVSSWSLEFSAARSTGYDSICKAGKVFLEEESGVKIPG